MLARESGRRIPSFESALAAAPSDVDHAARIIERFAMHWQARVAGGAKQRQHFAERSVDPQSNNVGARHHHILDPHIVQAENIGQNSPFLRGEIRIGAGADQGVLEIIAHRGRPKAEQSAKAFEQPSRRFPRRRRMIGRDRRGPLRLAHASASIGTVAA
jgi:hypothetical protein